MNTLRILCLAMLGGVATTGTIWYLWGIVENIAAIRTKPATNDTPEVPEET